MIGFSKLKVFTAAEIAEAQQRRRAQEIAGDMIRNWGLARGLPSMPHLYALCPVGVAGEGNVCFAGEPRAYFPCQVSETHSGFLSDSGSAAG
jgi:hypothetical protein